MYQGGDGIQTGLELFDIEKTNIQAGWDWAERNLRQSSAAASLCSSYPDAGAYVLDLRLHPREKIRWLETAVAVARQLKDRGAEGRHLGNLGNAYKNLGDARKAIEYYQQALAIAREISDRRNEGAWLGNLGLAYADLGDARKAIEYYDQALAISREIGDRRGEGNHSWNLGLEYEKAGDLERAADLMQVCVDYERKIGHPDAEKDAQRLDDILERLKMR